MRIITLVGIGTGDPNHLTLAGMAALRAATHALLPLKGEDKADLADLRAGMLALHAPEARIESFAMPIRDADGAYLDGVHDWHDAIAARYRDMIGAMPDDARVALLVWGDPSLYDSTLRVLERVAAGGLELAIRVVPGITAIQALTAAFAIPLNGLGAPVLITTGRRLAQGWPAGVDRVAVMLDGTQAFSTLAGDDFDIWWGAYLGAPEQMLVSGRLADVRDEIVATRAAARAQHGWIMDTYLLARR